MFNFKELSWEFIVDMAKMGRLAPHRHVELALLLEGTKPVVLTSEDEVTQTIRFFNDKIDAQLIPNTRKEGNLKLYPGLYAIYLKGNDAVVDELGQIFGRTYNGTFGWSNRFKNTLNHDIDLGRALGYTEYDICKYIINNYTIDEFEEWQQFQNEQNMITSNSEI